MGASYSKARRTQVHIMYRYKTRARVVADILRKYMKTAHALRLLDFGTADGLTLEEIASLVPLELSVGVEYSQDLVRNSPQLLRNIRIEEADVLNLPPHIANRTFDVVTALCFLEHVGEPHSAIKRAVQLLKDGGIFIAIWPTPLLDRVFVALASPNGKYHISRIPKHKMISMVTTAGMDVLTYQLHQWLPFRYLARFSESLQWLSAMLSVERAIESAKILNWSFVWQVIACRKSHC